MKVNGLQVQEHGSGYQVTISFHVGSEESESPQWRETFVSLATSVFLSIGAGMNDGTAGSHEPKEEANGQSAPASSAEAPAAAPGRRRRTNPNRPAGADAERPAADDHAPVAATSAADSSSVRRRRRLAQPAVEAPAGEVAGSRPTSRRRRTASTSASAAVSKAASTGGKTPAIASPSSAAITDADLSKAASLAASKVGASAVMDALEEFGVHKVNQVAPEQRQEFLDRMVALRG